MRNDRQHTRRAVGPSRWLVCGTVAVAWIPVNACSPSPAKPAAGLEMIISSEGLAAPTDFDDIKLEVSELSASGAPTKLWDRDYEVPTAEATLPTTFTLFSGQSADEVLSPVTAYLGVTPVVQGVAQVQVPTVRMATLYLVLASDCKGQVEVTGSEGEPMSTCVIGESCQPTTGTCGSNRIDVSALPTFLPGQSLDAGADAGWFVVPPGDGGAGGEEGNGEPEAAVIEAGAESGPMDATVGPGPSTDAMAQVDASGDGSPCTNACTESLTQCAPGGDSVQTCAMPPGSCTRWTTTTTCGAHQTCTGTGSAVSCSCISSICTGAGTSCQDPQTLATCMVDGNSFCPYVGSSSTCSKGPQSCSGMSPGAACSLTCTSSCSQGDTTCVSGSLATCTMGSNGCWAYGAPMACPSTHQTCIGSAGSAACTCNASSVCTSLASACADSATGRQLRSGRLQLPVRDLVVGLHGSTPFCNGAGVCGVCQDGATAQCSGNTLQTCASGQWVSGTACTGSTPFCNGAGVCGACQNGAAQCSGNTPQTCARAVSG